ncbi:inositol 2-dehydrogenase [uncultured Vagococcus sp.]|uniref:inositol 2-dehydrogenase n=1 Tax=uncultured Vagococcus sp. TaxID=189676 RepID=UPI002587C28A|nr:inositol 2-dehydrogenase [uncultured Vagococcus sp.]
MLEKIIVGVIGAGRIGKLHVENMLRMDNVEVKTVFDPFAENARSWSDKNNIKNLVTDASLVFNDPEINVVFICSPTDTHVNMINLAAKAGKHIFCEKPISFSDEETLKAYETVKKAGVKLQVGFNRRFDPNYNKVRELVKDGSLGNLHILKITSRDPEPPNLDYVKSSGGIFMDMAIHDFDMARFVAGSEVKEVFATGAALVNPDIATVGDVDTALIQLKFENGALGIIDNSRQAVYGYDQRIEAFGSKGAAESTNETETRVKVSTAENVVSDQPLHFFLERYNKAYIQEVQLFFDAIQNNEETPCTFEDGIMAQRIAAAAKESLESGQVVAVKKI